MPMKTWKSGIVGEEEGFFRGGKDVACADEIWMVLDKRADGRRRESGLSRVANAAKIILVLGIKPCIEGQQRHVDSAGKTDKEVSSSFLSEG